MWAPGERAAAMPPAGGVPAVDPPPPWAQWAAELRAMRPQYFRLIVDWSALQPDPALPPDLDRVELGCLRDVAPCAPYGGLRERLRALAARQRDGGWETLVVITWTPPWGGAPAYGCEPATPDPRARPPRPDTLDHYRRLVRDILAAAADAGAELRWWSPWNEPNHPGFLLPQRAVCDAAAPTAAAGPYAAIAQALREELDAAPGDQRLALAETAGYLTDHPTHTAVGEFVDALPTDLVCAADVWTTHAYVRDDDPVDEVAAALERRGCAKPIWVTETGIRGDAPDACARLDRRLQQWHADPRVAAAFQYTLRTDDRFRTGLVSTDLATAYPTLRAWQAWSLAVDGPPPAACG